MGISLQIYPGTQVFLGFLVWKGRISKFERGRELKSFVFTDISEPNQRFGSYQPRPPAWPLISVQAKRVPDIPTDASRSQLSFLDSA